MKRFRKLLTARSWETIGVIEVRMERRRNEGAGETGGPRKKSRTNDIVRHDSHMRKSSDPVGVIARSKTNYTLALLSFPSVMLLYSWSIVLEHDPEEQPVPMHTSRPPGGCRDRMKVMDSPPPPPQRSQPDLNHGPPPSLSSLPRALDRVHPSPSPDKNASFLRTKDCRTRPEPNCGKPLLGVRQACSALSVLRRSSTPVREDLKEVDPPTSVRSDKGRTAETGTRASSRSCDVNIHEGEGKGNYVGHKPTTSEKISSTGIRIQVPLVCTMFDTSWGTLAQLSPSTVAADNQCAVDVGIFVHKTVEPSLQAIEFFLLSPCRSANSTASIVFAVGTGRKLSDFHMQMMWERACSAPQTCGSDESHCGPRIAAAEVSARPLCPARVRHPGIQSILKVSAVPLRSWLQAAKHESGLEYRGIALTECPPSSRAFEMNEGRNIQIQLREGRVIVQINRMGGTTICTFFPLSIITGKLECDDLFVVSYERDDQVTTRVTKRSIDCLRERGGQVLKLTAGSSVRISWSPVRAMNEERGGGSNRTAASSRPPVAGRPRSEQVEVLFSRCGKSVGFHFRRGRATLSVACFRLPSAPGAAVGERLACSPSTEANRVQSLDGSLPNFRIWELCRMMPLVGGFSRGSPVSPPFHFSAAGLNHPLRFSRLRCEKPPKSFRSLT
ncbi:hypothetical protein PR048_006080 [Dryococelus australis]|uniref:Uncharacterized protein n=1 Tax=Dryococelus australis TaxID=614101 RepID=A0ABQ9IAK1_9NEOP|nr:hypothetical protein PR048_006080 [Dryococelus australis]